MEVVLKKSLLEFLDDLTDTQISRLVYYCLDCDIAETAKHRGISKQTVHQVLQNILKKRETQEYKALLQEILSERGFML